MTWTKCVSVKVKRTGPWQWAWHYYDNDVPPQLWHKPVPCRRKPQIPLFSPPGCTHCTHMGADIPYPGGIVSPFVIMYSVFCSPVSRLFLQLERGTKNVSHKTFKILYQLSCSHSKFGCIPYFVQTLTQGRVWYCFIPLHSTFYPVYHTFLDASSKVIIPIFIAPDKSDHININFRY